MLDEYILRYLNPGSEGECELVIGLDFGTSTSKVVVQAPDLQGGQAYAVNFGVHAQPGTAHLLPTRLWVDEHGVCLLDTPSARPAGNTRLYTNIKVALFDVGDGAHGEHRETTAEAIAVAYLALVLRYTRRWFLETQRDVIAHFEDLIWSVNLGIPSPYAALNEENRRFSRVGKAAWMLSVLNERITVAAAQKELELLEEAPDYWENYDEDLACDFDIIPEIAAGAVGYARSELRRRGVHLMVDIGAATVDVCSFFFQQQDDTHYGLLTADVQHLGTRRLYLERLDALAQLSHRHFEKVRNEHDPIKPVESDISETIDSYFVSFDEAFSAAREAEEALRDKCEKLLKGIIVDLRTRRAPHEAIWTSRLPILMVGGGSRVPYYQSLTQTLDAWIRRYCSNDGVIEIPMPVPRNLSCIGDDGHRLAVAWGLSHRALDVGEITPPEYIDDIVPIERRAEHAFIGKDQV